MIINGQALILMQPIKNMLMEKKREHGVSYGLSEAGYDIRIKQSIQFSPTKNTFDYPSGMKHFVNDEGGDGRFTIASAIEEFDMPTDLVGIVHDKSTWARQGLSVFNTVIEPGWKGFLTLELVYHGQGDLWIPAGAGIAQVVFHQTSQLAQYEGKYQNQEDKPIASIFKDK